MKTKHLLKRAKELTIKIYYLLKQRFLRPGSIDWLIGTEMKYGGRVTDIYRHGASPHDPRTLDQIHKVTIVGGDRMFHHGYARNYSIFLNPFIKLEKKLVIAEFGIFKGTGLALWSDLFPHSRIYGFDIDTSYYKKNLARLIKFGAFKFNRPKVYRYDQFINNAGYLGKILKNTKIDICIDDGCHFDQAIMQTMKDMIPFLADKFVYFIEDNRQVFKAIRQKYPNLKVVNNDQMTVVSR